MVYYFSQGKLYNSDGRPLWISMRRKLTFREADYYVRKKIGVLYSHLQPELMLDLVEIDADTLNDLQRNRKNGHM